LSEALASYAAGSAQAPLPAGDFIQAAVSVVIRAQDPLELLLIKRARSERDPWSGHMALPGGRRDPADASLDDAAVRETREETGLDLTAVGFPLGRLHEITPGSPRLPRLTIAPFVFGVPASAQASVASPEVAAVHWVALDELRARESQGHVDIALPDGSTSFPCYYVASDVVWGLTYRILAQFLEAYPDSALGRP
jgi:8-oxo-dGTP pyrophosphatase MutT (NUDIX family)